MTSLWQLTAEHTSGMPVIVPKPGCDLSKKKSDYDTKQVLYSHVCLQLILNAQIKRVRLDRGIHKDIHYPEK